MPNWLSGNVMANDISIHYTRTGGGGPPLVLAHGFSDAGLCWISVAQALEGTYDVIMPDARGHGLSDAPETGYDTEDQVADLVGFIRALGLERPALMGHSMGAGTVAALAAAHPDLPRCAVLEDPPWREQSPDPEQQRAMLAQRRAEILQRKASTREELMAACRERNPIWPEVELGPWAEAKLRLSPNVLNRRQGYGTEWTDVAARIGCPTLLITADPAKGGIVSPEVARRAVELNPGIRVAPIPGVGHNIRREAFDRFMSALTAFLAEHSD